MKLEYKDTGIGLRVDQDNTLSSDGQYIVGYASTFNTVDLGGDSVRPGAFRESLLKRPSVPVLRMHDEKRPIGKTALLVEDDVGLLFKARLSDTPDGNEMLTLIGDNVVSQMSFGYRTKKSSKGRSNGQDVRYLEAVEVFEISPCTWGMNPQTVVNVAGVGVDALLDNLTVLEAEQVKAYTPAYFAARQRQLERLLYEGKTQREWRYEMLYHIQEALKRLG